MRGGKIVGTMVGGWALVVAGGCASLDKYNRLDAAHRMVIAQKEQLDQELYDERHVTDNLRTRVHSMENQLTTKEELVGNLRRESELLDEMRRNATGALEGLSGKLTDITIEGSKLPPQLDTAIKKFAGEHPSEVSYDAQRGTVKWKADLLFPLGSDVVNDTSMDGLRSFTDILKSTAAADFECVVVGHTDTRPIQKPDTKAKHPTNWHLSAHRAISVGNILQKNGYAPERVSVMGCSEYRGIAENSSEAGQSQNRRVEIYIVPLGTIVNTTAMAAQPRSTVKTPTLGSPKPSTTK